MRMSDWSSDVCSSDLGAVANLAGGRGGDGATFLKQLDTRDAFRRRIIANAFVGAVHRLAFGRVDLHRNDLVAERAGLGRRDGPAVAFQRESVEIALGDRKSTRLNSSH